MVASSTARREVGTFSRLVEAQRAYSYLEGQNFPMERVTIVGEGVHPTMAVASGPGRAQATVDGAVSGAVTGLLLAFFLDLAGWMAPLTSGFTIGISGLVFGLIVGAVVGLIVHAVAGAQRAPATTTGVEAEQYSLLVDDAEADLAARLVGRVW